MTQVGDDLIQAMTEALAHVQGEGSAIVHEPVDPKVVRQRVRFTQAQMAQVMQMSLSGYRKWEQGRREVSGPANVLLRVIEKEPDAVLRALT